MEEDLGVITGRFVEVSIRVDLKVNAEKSKVMVRREGRISV